MVYGSYANGADDITNEIRVIAVNPTHNTVNPRTGGGGIAPHFTFKTALFCII